MIKQKSGGSKLKRTELIQLRTNTKLKFAIDLAALAQIRSVATFIESAVSSYLKTMNADRFIADHYLINKTDISFMELVNALWDVEPHIRFVRLAITAPSLLDFYNQQIWYLVKEQPLLWLSENRDEDSLNKPVLKSLWPLIEELGEEALTDSNVAKELVSVFNLNAEKTNELYSFLNTIGETHEH